jgi:FtsP/CotA-like multicopper oxidase with cupredoxin domain
VLKTGVVTGAASLLPRRAFAQEDQASDPPPAVAEPQMCLEEPANSPPHTPFADPLPIPPPALHRRLSPEPRERANTRAGEAARAPHQRWEEFGNRLGRREHELVARPALHTFHSDYSPTYIWGFNGRYPAETILNRYGLPTIVRFRNNLPDELTHTGFGKPEITIHLHNGHHGSESDGFAGDFFGAGLWKDNLYPNIYAGVDAFQQPCAEWAVGVRYNLNARVSHQGISYRCLQPHDSQADPDPPRAAALWFPEPCPADGDAREAMHTFWFHDHRAAFTAPNNYLGLNGMFLVYDQMDPGHEFATPGSLRLPGYYGITDIPLILTDKLFCATAGGRTELFQEEGGAPGGDKWIVNGAIQPRFTVRRRKYRFRILNTGPAKTWDLSLIKPDGTVGQMVVVATDANFLEGPVTVDGTSTNGGGPGGALRVSVAERYDVIIDFAQFPAGSMVYLRENAQQFVSDPPPPDPAPGLDIRNVLLRFDIVNPETWFPPDTPPIPAVLTTYPALPPTQRTFTWQFTRDPAGSVPRLFRINQLAFDANRVDHCILRGTTEEWLLDNNANVPGGPSAWTHPVHIHFEEFRVLKRFVRDPATGASVEIPVPPLQSGRKDVMRLNAGESALIKMQFRDYVGRYLIHCHNMGHEDAFMMTRWDIVATPQQLCQRQEEIIRQRRQAGVEVAAGLPVEKTATERG